MATQEDFYSRGKVAGVYPALSTRRDETYADFVQDARNILMHAQQRPIGEYSRELVEGAGLEMSPDPENTSRVIDVLMSDDTLKTYYRVKRSLQESFWNCIHGSYDLRRQEILDALTAAESKGPGTLEYDPDFEAPEYARAEIHIQPGGYVDEPLAGLYYDYGLKVFLGGSADNDFLAKAIARGTAVPKDGNVSRILDLGCSAGATTTALKVQHPDAEVDGIDISAAMVRYAHLRAVEQGIEVHYKQQAAEDLAAPDDEYDSVLAMLLFHEVPVPISKQILAEAFRVLRPGGALTVIDFPGDRSRDVYSMFFAEMDAADNGEPFLPGYVRSNVEDLMEETGFELEPYDPAKALLQGRIGYKPLDAKG